MITSVPSESNEKLIERIEKRLSDNIKLSNISFKVLSYGFKKGSEEGEMIQNTKLSFQFEGYSSKTMDITFTENDYGFESRYQVNDVSFFDVPYDLVEDVSARFKEGLEGYQEHTPQEINGQDFFIFFSKLLRYSHLTINQENMWEEERHRVSPAQDMFVEEKRAPIVTFKEFTEDKEVPHFEAIAADVDEYYDRELVCSSIIACKVKIPENSTN